MKNMKANIAILTVSTLMFSWSVQQFSVGSKIKPFEYEGKIFLEKNKKQTFHKK